MVEKKRSIVNKFDSKRGQVTIFIIIALLIIAGVIVVYMFVPGIKMPSKEKSLDDPYQYMQGCVSEELDEVTKQASLQGGSLNPESNYTYGGEDVEYLCRSSQYYDLCTVQRPFLRAHMEKEIEKGISNRVQECFSSMKKDYEEEGYDVRIVPKEMSVEILPERVRANLNRTLFLTDEGNSNKYENFQVSLNNNLYDRLTVAKSIIEWESAYGTAEPSLYMNIYHDLLVRKKEQSDETTIYIIENFDTGNKFQFASRSLAYPPGYGKPPARTLEEM